MRKSFLLCSLLGVSMIALLSVSAANPNFGGKWILDKKSSEGLRGLTAARCHNERKTG